jgi:DNA-binding MarR family transcriptional regulator
MALTSPLRDATPPTPRPDAPDEAIRQASPHLSSLIAETSRLFRRRFIQRARSGGMALTRMQAQVLHRVARHEGLSQTTLATGLDIEPITLVRLLDALQTAGLIERRPDRADRRIRTIWLTPAAQPILETIQATWRRVNDDALLSLSPDERRALVDLLGRIREDLLVACSGAEDDETLAV